MAKPDATHLTGPITGAELHAIGIRTREDVLRLGWQEAFLRWVEAYPARLNLNAAVGLIAVARDEHWLKVPAELKEEARELISSLKPRAKHTPRGTPKRKPRR